MVRNTTHVGVARLIAALMKGPLTMAGMQEVMGCTYPSAHKYKQALRAEGVLYIAGWVSGGVGTPSALYALGAGEDAPRPERTPRAKIQAAYRERRAAGVPVMVPMTDEEWKALRAQRARNRRAMQKAAHDAA